MYGSAKWRKFGQIFINGVFFDAIPAGGNQGGRFFLLFSERFRLGEKWQTSCNPMRGGAS
jgi:hypothetical protein